MLRPEQQEWVDQLSDKDTIKIVPFDPDSKRIFEEAKKEIQAVLGKDIEVLHRGASALGISGQAEIDIYIPVAVNEMEPLVTKLEKAFGKAPHSVYPEERIKFITFKGTTKLEIMVTNKDHRSWLEGSKHFDYMLKNKEALEAYKRLKEDNSSLTVREYYRRKIEFINDIIAKC